MQEQVFNFQDTTSTRKVFSLRKRIRAVAGGTSASKTISILVWLIDYAQSTRGELISVVSESFPHLSGGAMRDFRAIMTDRGYWDDSCWVQNPRAIYTFETGSKIEFISVDTYGKAHGPRRDVLFINECNNLAYNIVDQLITRTRKTVWLDWNPSEEFWFYTDMLPARPDDIDFLTLTYLDNEALDPITVSEIESHKGNKQWWTVYGLGQLGVTEQRIYKNWAMIDEVPHEARLERYGLDFGYTNDPTAVIAVYYHNGGYILDEIVYQKGLLNKQIADIILNQQRRGIVIADAAEPKSIADLRLFGLTVLPASKGAGSIARGIEHVQSKQISVTKSSLNLIKEYRSYSWITDKEGKIINEAQDYNNHCMDALRYAIDSLRNPEQRGAHTHIPQGFMPRNNLTPFQTQTGLAPELRDKPRVATTHYPRL